MSLDQFLAVVPSSVLWLAGLALLLTAAAHLGARASLRRWAADDGTDGTSPEGRRPRWWVRRALARGLAPIALLIWVHGGYAALSVVTSSLPAGPSGGVQLAASWVYGLAVTGALWWLLRRMGQLLDAFFLALSGRSETAWDDLVLPVIGTAVRYLLPLLALFAGATIVRLSPDQERIAQNFVTLVLIGLVAWTLVQVVNAAGDVVMRRHRIDVGDNLQARAVHTQIVVLKKVAHATIAIFTLASMLMVFESVRQFGASILASAGIAGIVVGLAAQRSIATLLAGFQIALTQPIRVDDVVIVENEWGRIEDITLTYVVVRIWDLRRLIVPITYFIEQPFQNWTRTSADVLGAVTLAVDYGVPVEPLRRELTRILEASPHWDGKVNVLQVTAASDRAIELRALASACDAGRAWDLRCEIREKLVAFLQREHPESLPRVRATVRMAAEPRTA